MAAAREEAGAERAAVGHTADDQAETVLLAVLRGGGLDAVAAVRPVTRTIVRPLLEVRRDETAAFCRSLGLRPRHDPMNDDPAFMRAAIRSRVIPLLEEALGRGVAEALARTAAVLQGDAALLDALADQAEATVFRGSDRTGLRADVLLALPRPLASRVVVRAIRALGGSPDAAHVEAVLALAAKPPGRRAPLPGGLAARREREYVRLSAPGG
jgi:tRNA(Ile)-lysidine synthase TilS/MesJ